MSLQSHRVQRLVRLREQQHLLTAMGLRTAQYKLHREEESLASVGRRMQGARDELHQAQQSGVVNDWLLACADTELCKAAIAHHHGRRVAAEQAVNEAAHRETAARTASKQMEHTFERIRSTEVRDASHKEQMHLDEVARNLRAFSNKPRFTGSPI